MKVAVSPHHDRLGWIGVAATLLLTSWLYWPGLGGGFAFDDISNLVNNAELRVTSLALNEWMSAAFSSPASSLQRPLAMVTFATNHYFTGMDASAMKLTNIAIHLVNTALVFHLLRTLLGFYLGARSHRALAVSLFVSAAWSVHPINLMGVLYVVQRMESLSHSFVLLGLCLYTSTRHRQVFHGGGWLRLWGSLFACTLLGLGAKESAALLPLYCLCLEICLFKFQGSEYRTKQRLWWLYGTLLFLPALAAISWVLPQALDPRAFLGRDFTLGTRLLTELRVLLDYLHWSVLPDLDTLSLYHDDYEISRTLLDPLSTLGSGLALASLLAVGIYLLPRRPIMSLGIFWFFSAHAITATVVPLELVFEHRNYFSSLGICIAIADLLLLAPTRTSTRTAGTLLTVILLALFSFQTRLRATEWSNPVRFALTEARKHPNSPRATYDLARILVTLSDYRSESPYFGPAMDAVELARKAPGASLLPSQAALILTSRAGWPVKQEWWNEVQLALRHDPIAPEELGALAAMTRCEIERRCQFPPADMLETFSAALEQGDNPEVLNIYGDYVLNVLGDVDLTLRLWRESARIRPNEPQYSINLAKLYIALGKYQDALSEIHRLRQMGRVGQNEGTALQLEALLKHSADRPPSSAGDGDR